MCNVDGVPGVTHQKIRDYKTGPRFCQCENYKKGGKYTPVMGFRACKHIVKLLSETHIFCTQKLPSGHWVCNCRDWEESGEGKEGSCVHTQALQNWPSSTKEKLADLLRTEA